MKCKHIVEKKSDNFFVYLPVEEQIKKTLIEHFETIIEFLNRPQSDDFADAGDGNVQKALTVQYGKDKVLSLTLNIEGGKIVDKSPHSLWPVQIYQNFLPPSLRFSPENILVVAIFYGPNHPNTFDLMYPLLNDLQNINNSGIQLMYNGVPHDFFLFLVYCACDLPARAMIQNFKHPFQALVQFAYKQDIEMKKSRQMQQERSFVIATERRSILQNCGHTNRQWDMPKTN